MNSDAATARACFDQESAVRRRRCGRISMRTPKSGRPLLLPLRPSDSATPRYDSAVSLHQHSHT